MKNTIYTHITHGFQPVYNENSKILILGTLPSVQSRTNNFYYGHKQNRFWRLIAGLLEVEVPLDIPQKKAMLLNNGIAIWDVIAECDIIGSSDSSIKNVVPTDLSLILNNCNISAIFANGATAKKLYDKYQKNNFNYDIICLPSTSPANAAWNMERLTEKWQTVREYL